MSTLVLVEDVPATAELLPHVGDLLAKGGVLPLQEGGAHGDLVLLQPPGIPRAFRRLVVLDTPAPVLVVLSSAAVWYVVVCGEEGRGRREQKKRRDSGMSYEGQICDERKDDRKGRREGRKEGGKS